MKQDSQPQTVDLRSLARTRDAGFRWISCNNVNAMSGAFDLTIIFGALVPDVGMFGKPILEDRVGVTMSWEHARKLNEVLTLTIRQRDKELQAGGIKTGSVELLPMTEEGEDSYSNKLSSER